MAKEKAPAFLFYPKDWLTDSRVRLMSPRARGFYIDALAICWIEGSLPSDPVALAKVLHCRPVEIRRLWKQIGSCFDPDLSKNWIHRRLNREREKQRMRSEQMRDNANMRWKSRERDAVAFRRRIATASDE